jgi:hypothetical protein
VPPFPEIQGVEFKHVENYHGYAVSNDGFVWTCKRTGPRGGDNPYRKDWIKVGTKSCYGYMIVNLRNEAGSKPFRVNILVAKHFIGEVPDGMIVSHYPDQNKENNAASNLLITTQKINMEHKKEQGTHQEGEKHGMASVTEDDVRAIRKLRELGLKLSDIGDIFGLTDAGVCAIATRRTWSHVE